MDTRGLIGTLTGTIGNAARRARDLAENAANAARDRTRGAPETGPLLDLSEVDDDEAVLLVRTMIAAAAADGVVDASERERLASAMTRAGLDADDRRFLEDEIAWPRDIEEIADVVATPEQAERVYAAARSVVDPDTMQEREFLRLLAERMDLSADRVAAIEARADGR